MLQALVSFSIRFRGVVIALACLVLGYGVYITLNRDTTFTPNLRRHWW